MENIKLEYFRLTLTENKQKSLLPQKSRTELIEDLFLNDIEFVSNKNTEYKYKFKVKSGNYILGFIYKKQYIEILEDPDNITPSKLHNWIPQIVIINNGAIKGENSQLFILQQANKKKNIKNLNFLNNCFANKLNETLTAKCSTFSASFSMVLEDSMTFWDYSNREDIKELVINYKMPNFLGVGDCTKNLNERLNHIKEQTNATNVTETITNKNGNLCFKQDDEDLNSTLELAKQGQSTIILKGVRQKIIYNSEKHEQIKSKEINIDTVGIMLADETKLLETFKSFLKELGLDNESNS